MAQYNRMHVQKIKTMKVYIDKRTQNTIWHSYFPCLVNRIILNQISTVIQLRYLYIISLKECKKYVFIENKLYYRY